MFEALVPKDIIEIANEWKDNIITIEKFLIDKNNITIRYEDLISNSEKFLKSVCDFIGIKFNEKMLNFYKPKVNDEPKSTLDWKMKTFEPVDGKNKNKYLKLLNNQEIELFNNISEKILKEYGYEL
jgi:hypothetical protein